MSAMASKITSLTIVYSTVYSRCKSKLGVTGLCEGNSPVTGEFPALRACNAEIFPFDGVIMRILANNIPLMTKTLDRCLMVTFVLDWHNLAFMCISPLTRYFRYFLSFFTIINHSIYWISRAYFTDDATTVDTRQTWIVFNTSHIYFC